MPRKIPPLNALRTFESVARLASFTKASQELHVTQGAVSRQIANLESWLAMKMFDRGRHSIQLTPQGTAYFESMGEIFDLIDKSTRALQSQQDSQLLKIKLPPTFAIRWLMPRLARFHARFPGTEVQITTSHQRVNFALEDVDISIHSEPIPPKSAGFVRLFGETLIPVCAPNLLTSGHPLHKPQDLSRHDRLCSMNRPNDWMKWLRAAGVSHLEGLEGLKFENAALAYQAATNGLGVMMGLLSFVKDDLTRGLLVAPFDLQVKTEGAYYLSYSDTQVKTQRVFEFESWLMEEVANDEADSVTAEQF